MLAIRMTSARTSAVTHIRARKRMYDSVPVDEKQRAHSAVLLPASLRRNLGQRELVRELARVSARFAPCRRERARVRYGQGGRTEMTDTTSTPRQIAATVAALPGTAAERFADRVAA